MFTLKHEPGSQAEREFLDAAMILSKIETVKKFERLRQTSQKCNHHFGFSMEFDSQADYETYNNHSYHSVFVSERWIPEVASFQEIDYVAYS
jgi:hypothetical protein